MKLLILLGMPLLPRWEEPQPVDIDETVVLRRWVYSGAGPGTGQELHNQAVHAERVGDLERALDLSRESYVKRPRRRGLLYIQRLEERISDQQALADLAL